MRLFSLGHGGHPLVARGMARLLALRREEGTWELPGDPTIETTMTALRLLHNWGSPSPQPSLPSERSTLSPG